MKWSVLSDALTAQRKSSSISKDVRGLTEYIAVKNVKKNITKEPVSINALKRHANVVGKSS